MTGFVTTVVRGAGAMFGYGPSKENNLDPMITMIQLAILGFMPSGTKVGFKENSLELQRAGAKQKLLRTAQEDSHNELDKLEEIIKNAIQYYRPSKNKVIQEIFTYSIKGLEQLRNTYLKEKTANIPTTLTHFISLLETNLPSTEKKEGSSSKGKAAEETKLKDLKVEEMEPDKILPVMQKVIAIWTKEGYEEVLRYLDTAKTLQGDISVDVKEKGTREVDLLGTFITHKVNVLRYVLDAELKLQGK